MIKFIILYLTLIYAHINTKTFDLKNILLDSNTQEMISNFWKQISNDKILFDESLKKIIVLSTNKEHVDIFKKLIKKIDKPKKSIHIQISTTRFTNQTQNVGSIVPLLSDLNNRFVAGINWFGIYNRNRKDTNFTFQGIGGDVIYFPTPGIPTNVIPTNFNLQLINNEYTITHPTEHPSHPGVVLPFTFGSNMATARLSNLLNLEDTNIDIRNEQTNEFITQSNQPTLYISQDSLPLYTLSNFQNEKGEIYQTYEIQYKGYGTYIKIKPRIADNDTIVLKIFLEKSTLDNVPVDDGSGLFVQKVIAPLFGIFRIKETVYLKSGESVVIATSLGQSKIDSFGKVPFLCKIPIIGKLFTSEFSNFADNNSLIVITPTIFE